VAAESPVRLTLVSRRVHPAHGPGGLERHVGDQVLHLAAAGVDVTLYSETPRDPERRQRADELLGTRATVHWIPPGRLPLGSARGTVVLDRVSNYPAWARRVAEAAGDPGGVLHAHGLAGLGFAEAREGGRLTSPFVLTTHGMEEFLGHGLKHALYAPFRAGMQQAARAADRVIVTDAVLVPLVTDLLELDERRTVLIPNVIDPGEWAGVADPSAARRLLEAAGRPEPEILLTSLGRLEANKGFDRLAAALGRVRDDLGDWCWVLIGDGPQRAALERAIDDAGIRDRTILAGRVAEPLKHGLLERADWFVHPTLFEGSSLVTLEAMAHGLPVLGTRAGGLPDKVEEGRSGFLVEPDDVAALAAVLRELPGQDALALGNRSRAIVAERFSWDAAVPRFIAMYRELMGGA